MSTPPATVVAPAAGSNMQAAKQAVYDEAKQLGTLEGKGKSARLKLAQLAVARAHTGEIDVNDAEPMWQNMMQGAADEQQDIGGQDPKDTKQRAGDLKNFIMLGANQ